MQRYLTYSALITVHCLTTEARHHRPPRNAACVRPCAFPCSAVV